MREKKFEETFSNNLRKVTKTFEQNEDTKNFKHKRREKILNECFEEI
jgi:hypothetical protein